VPYRLLAFDFDETLAMDGRMTPVAADALAEAKAAGWLLALVTGRPHDDLLDICPECGLFDLIVPENGCLLHTPADGAVEHLAEGPVDRLREGLTAAGIESFNGRVVTIIRRHKEADVRDLLARHGLAFDCFVNRYAMMIVPVGVSKATGLAVGLKALGVALAEVIAVGDDENDLAMLAEVGLPVAVGNATEPVKAGARLVLDGPNGEGVAAFIRDRVLAAPDSLPAPVVEA